MRILSTDNWLAIAKQLNQQQNGVYGKLPLFKLVQWVDERMGMGSAERFLQISQLVANARLEQVDGERTADAISFDRVEADLSVLVPIVVAAVEMARDE